MISNRTDFLLFQPAYEDLLPMVGKLKGHNLFMRKDVIVCREFQGGMSGSGIGSTFSPSLVGKSAGVYQITQTYAPFPISSYPAMGLESRSIPR